MKFLSGSQQCFNNFELHSIYMRLKHLPQYDLLTYIYFVLFAVYSDDWKIDNLPRSLRTNSSRTPTVYRQRLRCSISQLTPNYKKKIYKVMVFNFYSE